MPVAESPEVDAAEERSVTSGRERRAFPAADLGGLDGASCLLSDAAFGHVGAGGSIGFACPETQMSFGYTMNQMGLGLLLNDRGQSLVDEAYKALGYRSNASGVWDAWHHAK